MTNLGAGADIDVNLERVRERIARAARRAGRAPEDVRLVAVTKGVPVDRVRRAIELGVSDLGENRVQEGAAKRAALAGDVTAVSWHLIGHLQTNKAGRAAETFDLIHSVDGLRVAEALSRRVSGSLPVLLQVNVSGEASKFGVGPEEAGELLRAVSRLPGLVVRGLMTMAPLVDDPEETRPIFRRLARLARELGGLRLPGVSLDLLSMGMTQDFEVAISEGANLVRIGSAIFGPREG
ncbi:MAG: YggS family pyridoxal phosphate-dependent enzyme [Bacillota bacterium]|jgi:pyridoxal phosphate enzyme (YggS family)